MPIQKLSDLLFTQGFGSRRECEGLVLGGHVRLAGASGPRVCVDPAEEVAAVDGLAFEVRGCLWTYFSRALIIMHKPAGYECSQKPKHHPSVYSLLPAPLRQREVQAVGRLDTDTTGLLLLTDDGALIHKITSPKHHVPKVYEVVCRDVVTVAQVQQLLGGVVLNDSFKPVMPAACEQVADHHVRLTLIEGKYHQVKRMLAAVGNHVESLHRSSFGSLALPDDLAPGTWRWVTAAQRAELEKPRLPVFDQVS
jgi:16S rRNA pseudouridine516 synthase